VSPDRMRFSPEFEAELDRRIAEDDAHPELGIPWEEIDAAATARDAR
jgi:putative addiction module component (TIGR02574 family)